MEPLHGSDRLHPLLNLIRYDHRRLLGLLALLRLDLLAVVACVLILLGLLLGGAYALTMHGADQSWDAALAAGFVSAVGLVLAFNPLPGLLSGPLRELADDRAATPIWLFIRALGSLGVTLLVVTLAALQMGGRPGAGLVTAMVGASVGAGIAAVIAVRLRLPWLPPRKRTTKASRSSGATRLRIRVVRLAWIDLSQWKFGLPVGVWAMACWASSLLVGFAVAGQQGAIIADGAAAMLALLATVLTLRFDTATARLLSFEPTSFFRLASDVLGGRLLMVLVVGALFALVTAPAVLAGVILGAGYRTLEFLHSVRRSAAAASLLAQMEMALVVVLALVAGPAALVWLMLRSAWLYRHAERAMGLT